MSRLDIFAPRSRPSTSSRPRGLGFLCCSRDSSSRCCFGCLHMGIGMGIGMGIDMGIDMGIGMGIATCHSLAAQPPFVAHISHE